MDIVSLVNVVGGIYKIIADNKDNPQAAIKKGGDAPGALYRTKGNMIELLSDFIVEPILVVSEDAMINGTITDKMSNVLLDIFTGYYLQSFNVLNNIYNIDSKTILNVLSTDNGMKSLKTGVMSNTFKLITESAVSNSYNDLMELTMESGKADLVDYKAGVLGNALLNRNVKVEFDVKTVDGARVNQVISIPITIKARVLKVTTQNILDVSSPNRKHGGLTTWLDYKASLATFWDFAFQTKAVNKYKENRLKGNEFLEIINSRKLSSTAKLMDKSIAGFELNYNLLLLTDNDKKKIEKETDLNIFKEKEKNEFLNSTYCLTCAVMDEDYEQVSLLTPGIRGISTVSYKEVKNMNNKSNNDMTDLVKAIMSNKSLF